MNSVLRLHRLIPVLSMTLVFAFMASDSPADPPPNREKLKDENQTIKKPDDLDRNPTKPASRPDKEGWIALFDGKSLKGWEVTEFGGEGEVKVEDGNLMMMWGQDLTGVHTKRKLPKTNYEVELECMRVDGLDFFCGLTFPVKESHASLIIGGWGGGVCGISSIDRLDASENETTTYRSFDNKKWYPVRLKVTDDKIEAWCEGKQIVDVNIKDRIISTRSEVDLSKPFGLSCWQTTAAIRKLRIRELKASPSPESSSDQQP